MTITVFLKEIKEFIRDRRALMITIFIPLILFPVIIVFIQYMNSAQMDKYMAPVEVALYDTERIVSPVLEAQESWVPVFHDDPSSAVRRGEAPLGLEVTSQRSVTVYTTEGPEGDARFAAISGFLDQYGRQTGESRLPVECRRILHNSAIAIERKTPEKAGDPMAGLLLPLLLLTYAAVSPLALAADTGAGERERGTLEPLLATGAPRGAIVMGKFLAVAVAGTTGVAAFLTGLSIAFHLVPPEIMTTQASLPPLSFMVVLALSLHTMVLVLFYSALELAVSVYVRSVKEAQALGVAILMLTMAVGYTVYVSESSAIPAYMVIMPVLNAGMALRELVTDGTIFYRIWAVPAMVPPIAWLLWISFRRVNSEKMVL